MSRRNLAWAGVLACTVAAFLAGLNEVLRLRTGLGDAFPPYSTYRADPLGAQALHDALARVPGLRVERNERDLKFLRGDETTLLAVLGVQETPDPVEIALKLEEFLAGGGRLLIAYAVRGGLTDYCVSPERAEALSGKGESGASRVRRWIAREDVPALAPPEERGEEIHLGKDEVLLSKRWGFRVVAPMDADAWEEAEDPRAVPAAGAPFARPVSWKSPEYFVRLAPEWEVIYTDAKSGEPLMMRRGFGKGEIIAASDSYLFSNEAMRSDRQPELLARVLGSSRHVVFEETTKGVDRSPGIAGLARQYRLQLLMAMAVLLGALYVWRGAVPLVPRRSEAEERERALVLLGRDAHAGLAALLRRAVPPAEVLQACLSEWSRTAGRNTAVPAAQAEEARQILLAPMENAALRAAEGQIVERYRAAAALLRERRAKP